MRLLWSTTAGTECGLGWAGISSMVFRLAVVPGLVRFHKVDPSNTVFVFLLSCTSSKTLNERYARLGIRWSFLRSCWSRLLLGMHALDGADAGCKKGDVCGACVSRSMEIGLNWSRASV
ncbi:hypothetical protein LZ31DRAFT_204647 [Colletotrichum somersetense]|nr:hypothetical protein LZ31DRAFT_204647 [Colletotrichum somersetense]